MGPFPDVTQTVGLALDENYNKSPGIEIVDEIVFKKKIMFLFSINKQIFINIVFKSKSILNL